MISIRHIRRFLIKPPINEHFTLCDLHRLSSRTGNTLSQAQNCIGVSRDLSVESSDSFVASTIVSIATGWSEPVLGRKLHPLKSRAFSRHTFSPARYEAGHANL